MRDLELHCPNCGVLLRRMTAAPRQCPECSNRQIVVLGYSHADKDAEQRNKERVKGFNKEKPPRGIKQW